jgi:hypothetical protein
VDNNGLVGRVGMERMTGLVVYQLGNLGTTEFNDLQKLDYAQSFMVVF